MNLFQAEDTIEKGGSEASEGENPFWVCPSE